MTDDQMNAFVERFVLSFEKMATALEGVCEIYRQEFSRRYPKRGEVREAVITHVPSEEDRIRESQGATDQTLSEWLTEQFGEGGDVGDREREWLETHPESWDAGAEA